MLMVCYDTGMSRKAAPVTVTPEEREYLETLAASRTAPYRQVQRARLVLAAAGGKTNQAISQETGLGWRSVGMWRQRFIRERLAGLEDQPRPGKPRQYSDADFSCYTYANTHTHRDRLISKWRG